MKEGLTSYPIEDINLEVEKEVINKLITNITRSKGLRYEIKPYIKDHIIVGLNIKIGDWRL